ncbi:MAG: ABC transporter ATP-binding protein [Selenomonadaceae bacterium]|nr:ABC transporter ATP-binding protein [Selenomonadaceae bacterium]
MSEGEKYLAEGVLLHNVKLKVKQGSITGIAGPDGAGKTTLLRMVCGLIPLGSDNSLRVLDMDIKLHAEKVQGLISYMPQKFGLYEDLTVQENIDLYAELHDVPKALQADRVTQLLKLTDMEAFTSRLAGRLSGGMKQKLGLICTLVASPKLLVLDEPSVGVDPLSRREIWEIIQQQVAEGLTVLVSTAYLEEAQKCQQIYMLDKGGLLASGKFNDLQQEWPKGLKGLGGDTSKVQIKANNEETANTENKSIDIRVKNLVKRFGDFTAVDNTSFQVQQGEIFGMLGPNGAGKTTTFRMLCGLLPATSGELEVAVIDVRKNRRQAREGIGYVAQKFSLYGNLTAYENLRFYGGIYGLKGKNLQERILEVSDELGLTDRQQINSEMLPLGYKQRLSMAAALLHKPKILFLDEPTSGIDPLARKVFWQQIDKLAKSGTTIIVTTHFMEEADYCHRIMIQDQGKMLAIGSPDEIRKSMNMLDKSMNDIFIAIVEKNREGR